jgi:hypothetical protein
VQRVYHGVPQQRPALVVVLLLLASRRGAPQHWEVRGARRGGARLRGVVGCGAVGLLLWARLFLVGFAMEGGATEGGQVSVVESEISESTEALARLAKTNNPTVQEA